MTPGWARQIRIARWSRGARAAAAAVLVLGLSACKTELYEGLSQRDANEMTARLLESGVDAERVKGADGTYLVRVSEEDFVRAVKIVEQSGLPRQQFATLGQLFNDDRLIATPTEERARFIYGLSQELSHTVSDIAGVISARVHIVLPARDGLDRAVEPATASVAIRHDQTFDSANFSPRIRQLVADSVETLQYENVSLALFPMAQASEGGSADPGLTARSAQTQAAASASPPIAAAATPEQPLKAVIDDLWRRAEEALGPNGVRAFWAAAAGSLAFTFWMLLTWTIRLVRHSLLRR